MFMNSNLISMVIRLTGLVLMCAGLTTANYKGVVKDSLSSTGIDSVLVKLKGTSLQTYTNSQGQFTLGTSTGLLGPRSLTAESPVYFDAASRSIRWDKDHQVSAAIYNMHGKVVARLEKCTGPGFFAVPSLPAGTYIVGLNVDGTDCLMKMMVAGTVRSVDIMLKPANGRFDRMAKTLATNDTLVFSKNMYTVFTPKQVPVTANDTNLVIPLYGFPGKYNTGYRNAPGYTGSLTTFSGTIQSNQTYQHMYFPGGALVGTWSLTVKNVTFIGCRFTSNSVSGQNVGVMGDNITFTYCSFEPSAVSAPPVANASGYQFAINQMTTVDTGRITIDKCDFWGWANAIQFEYSSQTRPFVVRNSWFHDARNPGSGASIDHTDAILENWGGSTVWYMIFDHNTIVSRGTTNGLALQGTNYSNVTVTNNYFSGFGNTVALGQLNNNLTFTGNVYGTDFQPDWSPLYGGWTSGTNNLWRHNKWHVVPGVTWRVTAQLPAYMTAAVSDGQYWWPTAAYDTPGCVRATDYAGN
jgi:hypothetical protein